MMLLIALIAKNRMVKMTAYEIDEIAKTFKKAESCGGISLTPDECGTVYFLISELAYHRKVIENQSSESAEVKSND